LSEDYYDSADNDKLRYVIGDQDRVLDGNVYTADVKADVGYENYVTDDNGLVKIVVTYDPPLTGHTYSLGVNSYKDTVRSGASSRVAFRGIGYDWSASPAPIKNEGNTHYVTLTITIKPSGDYLDGVEITPQSISFDSQQCTLNSNSDLHVKNGKVTVKVDTQTVASGDTECNLQWVPNNSSIYYEY
jgi:hypothetical protein